LRPKFLDKKIMSISPIFMFAPVPLTNERSPLAHAAAIVRRRLADNPVVAVPRHRIPPPAKKKAVDAALV
jgi:hypothetical protein